MTVVLEQEDKLLMQAESIKHMTEKEIEDFLNSADLKYLGQRLEFILGLVKEGDWSFEEGLEEIHKIANVAKTMQK